MSKVLQVEFSDGRVFEIPASFIATDRARYYANIDHIHKEGENWLKTFETEVDYALEDDFELLDWANNDMNWEDVQREAEEVDSVAIDEEAEWPNARKSVVEVA